MTHPLSSQQNAITFCAQYTAENPLLVPLNEALAVAKKQESLSETENNIFATSHLYALCKSSQEDPNKEEILYIGQCFGQNGEGDLLGRLTHEPCLVEIIERAQETWPQDIFSLLLFPFSHEPYLLPAQGVQEAEMANHPDFQKKIEKIQRLQVPLRRKTDILEVALISHFLPYFNAEYPKKISSSLAKILDKFAQAAISALLVEFSTENLEIEFFSQAKAPQKEVLLPFDISSRPKRLAFLSLQQN